MSNLLYFRPILEIIFHPTYVKMRFVDFCWIIFTQLHNNAKSFVIEMPSEDVTFSIVFKEMFALSNMFAFWATRHVAIHPLTSIIQCYIQLGSIQKEKTYGSMFETILGICREEHFHYNRFINKRLLIQLVPRGTLTESFFEIFNWVSSPCSFSFLKLVLDFPSNHGTV